MSDRMDLVLDFTHTYDRSWVDELSSLCYVDCSDIEGTDMYCTPEAEEELAARIGQYPLQGIHFIDGGNYHYMTRLFTRRMGKPYQLIFFDHHSDMQPTMIPEFTSCGAWARQVLEEDEYLKKMVLIGPSRHTIEEIGGNYGEKLYCVSQEALCPVWDDLDADLPVYLSIDKDVLSEKYACTNWDQGDMSLPVLCGILQEIGRRFCVIGADICGEQPDALAWQEAKVRSINEQTNETLYRLLREMISIKSEA